MQIHTYTSPPNVSHCTLTHASNSFEQVVWMLRAPYIESVSQYEIPMSMPFRPHVRGLLYVGLWDGLHPNLFQLSQCFIYVCPHHT